MAALLSGQSVSATAREYKIPKSTAMNWKKQLTGDKSPALSHAEEIGDLIVAYLRENLVTLAAQMRHFRDPEWLKKQPANELAVLHGVTADKAIRLLEAIEPADGAGDE